MPKKLRGFTLKSALLSQSDIKVRGFTLIELLVVISIIAILMAVATVSYSKVQQWARDQKRQTDLAQIATALQRYYQDHGFYPNTNYDGQFQSAGRDPIDAINCLLGGLAADIPQYAFSQGPPVVWKPTCTNPRNTYIANGVRLNLPSDPLYNDIEVVAANYSYASNGQTYAIVSQKFEGTVPAKHAFTDQVQPWWGKALEWGGGGDGEFWSNRYVIVGPPK